MNVFLIILKKRSLMVNGFVLNATKYPKTLKEESKLQVHPIYLFCTSKDFRATLYKRKLKNQS